MQYIMKPSKKHSRKYRAKKGGSASLNPGEISATNTIANAPSFQGIPIRYFYDMNDYNTDPNNPAVITNARLSGGKSRKFKKSKKTAKSRKNGRRQRGGFNVFSNTPFLGSASYNTPASFGAVPFAFISKDFIAGNVTSLHPQNPSTIQHPSEFKYNAHNPPLV
jgi:hypothetical protein